MIININGLTDMTLSLNAIGQTLRGKTTLHNINVSDAQLRSLNPLVEREWIDVVEAQEEPVVEAPKVVVPKTVKKNAGIKQAAPVNELVPGDILENQEAVVVDSNGNTSKRRMSNNASLRQSQDNSPALQASLSTQAKLEKEAAQQAQAEAKPMNESALDVSEKSGQEAVVGTGSGTAAKVKPGKPGKRGRPSKKDKAAKAASPFIPPEEYGQHEPKMSDIMVDLDGNPVKAESDEDNFIE